MESRLWVVVDQDVGLSIVQEGQIACNQLPSSTMGQVAIDSEMFTLWL